jgi:Myb-like DNA-binding domain
MDGDGEINQTDRNCDANVVADEPVGKKPLSLDITFLEDNAQDNSADQQKDSMSNPSGDDDSNYGGDDLANESVDDMCTSTGSILSPNGSRSSRGKWTPEEDEILRNAVQQHGGKNWKKISDCLDGRTDVQCLHRWQKVLRPGLVKGPWTKEVRLR